MIANMARRIGRYVALPVVSAGIIGGAALGLAGMANAATPSYNPEPRRESWRCPRPRPNRPPRPTPAGGGTGITFAARSVDCVAVHSALRKITTARSAPRSGSSTPSGQFGVQHV